MRNSRPDILSRPLFILALGLLLLNDFYLKYENSNFLTGKLSDFAGLFLFPYFLSSLRINLTKTIFIATALLFIFWKSEFSQSIIEWFQMNGIGFNRVVDYTDFVALLILPLSYNYFQKELKSQLSIHKALTLPISILSLFAIWATTLPREQVVLNLKVDEVYEVKMSKAELLNSIQAGHGYSNTFEKNMKDSLFYLRFDIVEGYRAEVIALSTITSIDSNRVIVRFDMALFGCITGQLFRGVDNNDVEHFKSLSAKDFKAHFETNFINPIKNGKTENIYYDNKEIHDLYEK